MHKLAALSPLLVLTLGLSACGPEVLAIEVLPARTGAGCLAPSIGAAALGRGLLDLRATLEHHGAYAADLRITMRKGELRMDGIKLGFVLPDDAAGAAKAEADSASAEIQIGTLFLRAVEDEVQTGMIENVILLPRTLAVELLDDGVDVSRTEYASIVIEMLAMHQGEVIGDVPSTFTIDVCDGCLMTKPSDEDCPDGVELAGVCRPGQEQNYYTCSEPIFDLPISFP